MPDISQYEERMKALLGEREYEQYERAMQEKAVHGIRVNTLKCSSAFLKEHLAGMEEAVPWCPDGFYETDEHVGRDPYAYAGLFYQQEPSAMLPGALLPVKEGDRVLDLCAAPGGKSVSLAAKLNHTGLLWANDISVSRARILLRNLERSGVEQMVVSAESPAHLAERLPSFFDCVLVDAPCSGEGMFRKEPSLKKDWVEKGPAYYAPLQAEILEQAVKMLKDGGYLVYSTCTFSETEDEENVRTLLAHHPEMHVCDMPDYEGVKRNAYGMKLFPHCIKGEGHFAVLLQKDGVKKENRPLPAVSWSEEGLSYTGHGILQKIKDRQLLSVYAEDTEGLRILRNGLLLGEYKKGRFTPSEALAMSGAEGQKLNLSHEDGRVMKYLHGETIEVHDEHLQDGWTIVCVDGWPLGFGTVKGKLFKNKYARGWIIH